MWPHSGSFYGGQQIIFDFDHLDPDHYGEANTKV